MCLTNENKFMETMPIIINKLALYNIIYIQIVLRSMYVICK